ncbi:hypothetical protein GCM10009126_31780 [Rhodanobacter caeni]|uniref:Uncharacterized protein n=1 Tax=Rhodanobacter caeni TaxID=657654 RepID=A0ABN0UWK1_9GAMM
MVAESNGGCHLPLVMAFGASHGPTRRGVQAGGGGPTDIAFIRDAIPRMPRGGCVQTALPELTWVTRRRAMTR